MPSYDVKNDNNLFSGTKDAKTQRRKGKRRDR
jgi:hypothetical protein